MPLSWSLVVATYNRPDVLAVCIDLALKQTRPTSEIVVIDASADWTTSRDRIVRSMKSRGDVRVVYEKARAPSLAVQRNQGLAHATSDIVFLLDDDSLMFPDCAERVMAVYEADRDSVVVGAQAQLSEASPPEAPQMADIEKKDGGAPALRGDSASRVLTAWLRRHVFLHDAHALHIPYDGGYPSHTLPTAILQAGAVPCTLFHGCRMTFRRELISRVGFDAALLSYCPGEDLDASYRASRLGALVEVRGALLHHFTAKSGRIDRRRVTTLAMLNGAFLVRQHATSAMRDRFRVLVARRVLAELLKDVGTRRWTLPQFLGALDALRLMPTLFAWDDREMRERYMELQSQLLAAREPPRAG